MEEKEGGEGKGCESGKLRGKETGAPPSLPRLFYLFPSLPTFALSLPVPSRSPHFPLQLFFLLSLLPVLPTFFSSPPLFRFLLSFSFYLLFPPFLPFSFYLLFPPFLPFPSYPTSCPSQPMPNFPIFLTFLFFHSSCISYLSFPLDVSPFLPFSFPPTCHPSHLFPSLPTCLRFNLFPFSLLPTLPTFLLPSLHPALLTFSFPRFTLSPTGQGACWSPFFGTPVAQKVIRLIKLRKISYSMEIISALKLSSGVSSRSHFIQVSQGYISPIQNLGARIQLQ